MLVGEIRDKETAEIAIQASLTGHLVLSTLHTNDAASALTRLVDMGVEPFLVGSSLVAVLAQRLVRVLCKSCKEAYTPTDEELREIGVQAAGPAGHALPRRRLPGLQPHGLSRPHRDLRADADRRRDPRAPDPERRRQDDQGDGDAQGHGDAARRWRAQGPRRARPPSPKCIRATEEEGSAAQV